MARSDLLRQLFAAYSRGDDAAFRAAALQIVADERRKEHRLLAADLEEAINSDRRPGATTPLTLRPIPKGRDDRPLLSLTKPRRELDDLVLAHDVRQVLADLIQEHLSRSLLAGHGLRPRQRLLFVGTSGTGKSASSHALAAELSLPVASVSMAALTSSYLGETARNVEGVIRFAEATPCVLLFDEFDAIAGERSSTGDHAELRRVVATVLHLFEEMHGESILVATSNHPLLLDSALWRRFDEVAVFDYLSEEALAHLIDLRLRGFPHSVGVAKWARRLREHSPADVELVCQDALRRWALTGQRRLDDKVMDVAVQRMDSRRRAIARLRTSEEPGEVK
jgi:SpoVK/Ycf46/Vps4 family AAA+-type ATPase